MYIQLKRYAFTYHGVFGIILIDGIPEFLTLEDPYKFNEVNLSCVPKGVYRCTPHNGYKWKDTWVLNDVPGRSHIVIHQGNTHEDTHGCILLGKRIGSLNGVPAILDSLAAFNEFKARMPEEFTLSIEE